MRVISIQEINRALREEPAAFVARTEESYAAQIRAIAEDIRDHAEERPVVLLSGPSGSLQTAIAVSNLLFNCINCLWKSSFHSFPQTVSSISPVIL